MIVLHEYTKKRDALLPILPFVNDKCVIIAILPVRRDTIVMGYVVENVFSIVASAFENSKGLRLI